MGNEPQFNSTGLKKEGVCENALKLHLLLLVFFKNKNNNSNDNDTLDHQTTDPEVHRRLLH